MLNFLSASDFYPREIADLGLASQLFHELYWGIFVTPGGFSASGGDSCKDGFLDLNLIVDVGISWGSSALRPHGDLKSDL